MFTILFFGDVVGAIGRHAIAKALPDLREEYAPDLILANVENLAHGRGITAKTLSEMDATGIDAYTSGNHVWENAVGLSCFEDERWKNRLVRPANVDPKLPGRGLITLDVHIEDREKPIRVAILNLLGQLFMNSTTSSPFLAADRLIESAKDADVILVDIHAETTSEKEALGHYLDGRVTAVFGTHTHVQTADEKFLPHGTAYMTDVGRNGAHDSVVGFEPSGATRTFLNPGTKEYEIPEHGKAEIGAVLLSLDLDTKRIARLDRIRRIVDA